MKLFNNFKGVVFSALFVGALSLCATPVQAGLQTDDTTIDFKLENGTVVNSYFVGPVGPMGIDLTAGVIDVPQQALVGGVFDVQIDFFAPPPGLSPPTVLTNFEARVDVKYTNISGAVAALPDHTIDFLDLEWRDGSGNIIPTSLINGVLVLGSSSFTDNSGSILPKVTEIQPDQIQAILDFDNMGGGLGSFNIGAGQTVGFQIDVGAFKIPEPSTYLMLGSMIVLVGLAKRKKRIVKA